MNGSVPHAKRLAGRERYARITRPFPGCCDGEEESQRRGISGRGVEEKSSMDVAKILAVSLREIYRNRCRDPAAKPNCRTERDAKSKDEGFYCKNERGDRITERIG